MKYSEIDIILLKVRYELNTLDPCKAVFPAFFVQNVTQKPLSSDLNQQTLLYQFPLTPCIIGRNWLRDN